MVVESKPCIDSLLVTNYNQCKAVSVSEHLRLEVSKLLFKWNLGKKSEQSQYMNNFSTQARQVYCIAPTAARKKLGNFGIIFHTAAHLRSIRCTANDDIGFWKACLNHRVVIGQWVKIVIEDSFSNDVKCEAWEEVLHFHWLAHLCSLQSHHNCWYIKRNIKRMQSLIH